MKCACESVHYLKGEALLHYEKYDMIVCYIIMTWDVSVIWRHKLSLWRNSGGWCIIAWNTKHVNNTHYVHIRQESLFT